MYNYDNILSGNYLSNIFEFQLVPLAFSLISGDSFMVSPPPPKVWGNGRRNFFPQNAFYWGTYFVGKIYSGIFLHVGTNDQNIPREKKFHKMYFPVM